MNDNIEFGYGFSYDELCVVWHCWVNFSLLDINRVKMPQFFCYEQLSLLMVLILVLVFFLALARWFWELLVLKCFW